MLKTVKKEMLFFTSILKDKDKDGSCLNFLAHLKEDSNVLLLEREFQNHVKCDFIL